MQSPTKHSDLKDVHWQQGVWDESWVSLARRIEELKFLHMQTRMGVSKYIFTTSYMTVLEHNIMIQTCND